MSPSRRALCRALGLGLLCGPLPSSLLAAPAARELRLLSAPDPAAQRPLLQALRQRYPALLAESDATLIDWHRAAPPVIALGPQALRRALEGDAHTPVIAALTSSQTYRRLLATSTRDAASTSAVFAEAPPAAQMQLIAALFERRVTVGVVLTDASGYLEKGLRQAATQAGLDVQIVYSPSGQDAVRAINGLPGVHALLAVPDSTLYTPDTLRAVLESTYRRGLPVIGFSAATVTAGTLAAAHADLDDTAADLADLIDGLPASVSTLPEARYPRYWRVALNDNVARSLGLPISDRLKALGSRPSGRNG